MGGVGILERALRDPETGWSIEATTPPPPIRYIDPTSTSPKYSFFSADLSRMLFSSATPFAEEQATPDSHPQRNGGVHLSDGKSNSWVSKPTWDGALPAPNTANTSLSNWHPEGASPSFDTVYFSSGSTHTPEDGESGRIPQSSWATYVWKDGELSNAGILPDGTISRGGSVAASISRGKPPSGQAQALDFESVRNNPVSRDGSSFLFVSPDPKHTPADASLGKPQLYMYRDGESTLLISGAHSPGDPLPTTPIDGTAGVALAGTAGRSTQGVYAVATPDHSYVVFSTFDALTDDAPTDEPETVKVYRYRTADGSLDYLPEMDHPLGAGSAASKGTVVAMSFDGEQILYVAAGSELRLWREGQSTRLVSTGVLNNGGGNVTTISAARFSEDGAVLFLQATGPLRGETRHILGTNSPLRHRPHIYRYEAATDDLECISCKAGYESRGARSSPTGPTTPCSPVHRLRSRRPMSRAGSPRTGARSPSPPTFR